MPIEAMLRSINLDHDLCGVAEEIRHVRSHGDLAAEMKFLKAMRLESVPEFALGRRHFTAQTLSLRPQVRFHTSMRGPIPSPLVGEG